MSLAHTQIQLLVTKIYHLRTTQIKVGKETLLLRNRLRFIVGGLALFWIVLISSSIVESQIQSTSFAPGVNNSSPQTTMGMVSNPIPSQATTSSAGTWNSSIIYKGEDGALVYHSDEAFNRIPDFSHAGYRGGGVPLPHLPVRITLNPSPTGEDSQQIQQALDAVGAIEPDENGHRGAVLLNPGTYRLNTHVTILQSGVVLRGSGDDIDPTSNTIIHVSKEISTRGIQIGRGNVNWNWPSGTPVAEITTDFIAVGNRHFEVSNASPFQVGDEIIIFHPATSEWIEAVEHGGRPATAPDPWIPNETNLNIMKLRTITGINGNVIAVDVPVYNHLNKQFSRSLIYKPDFTNRISEAGVEHLRLVLESEHPLADTHANNGIVFSGVVDSWAYGVTALHFRFQGLGATNSSFVTIQNARALEPHSPIDGGKRYNFNVSARANNILFTDVHASEGRHCFVSNGTASVSGVVFHNGTSTGAYAASEGHRRWSMALLFDNITFLEPNRPRLLGLYNRGNAGTRHGWSAAHSVAWNVDAGEQGEIIIQQPPTAQNYGIANRGIVTHIGSNPGLRGFIEGTGEVPELTSLYEAQLHDRLTYGIQPDTPTHLILIPNPDSTTVNLEWRYLSLEEIAMVIERSTADEPFSEIARIRSSQTSFTDTTISENEYRYRIAAVDNGRMSAWSNVVETSTRISSFILRSPGAGSSLVLSADLTRTFGLWWNATESGYPIMYTWYFDYADGDFSEPLLQRTSSNNLVQISHGDFDAALQEAGVEMGEAFEGKWTVKATAGPLTKWADTSFDLRIVRGTAPTSVEQISADLPRELELRQNFPNPFNPETVISFGLPESGRVELVVYDLLGREVNRLVDGNLSAGWHQVRLDASILASGTYIYRIHAGAQVISRMMTLLK
jgi:hypothetical protein